MKKILLSLFMVMFSANVFSMNNQKLEARPVLFIESRVIFYEGRILELKDASEKSRREEEHYDQELIKLRGAVKHVGNESDEERREKDSIYSAELDRLNLLKHQCGERLERVGERIKKRVIELSKEYAKEIGACGVIEAQSHSFPLYYIDPAYNITARVLEQLNREYSERS